MANNEIDSLSIGIQVNDNNSVAKLNEMSKAIDSLVSSLDGLKKMQGVLETLERTFKGINSSSGRAAKKIVMPNVAPPQYATAETNTSVGKLPEISSSTTQSLQEISDVIKTQINLITEDEHSIDRLRIAVGKLDGTYNLFGESAKEAAKVFEEAFANMPTIITEDEYAIERLKVAIGKLDGTYNLSGESAKEAAKAFGYVEKTANKSASAFSKFTRSVGRIAFYRVIRTALKEITQALQYGIQNYARYDSETNKAMSGIINATNQFKNTLGVTAGQLLQSFAPVLESIAGLATEVLNNINLALAAMQGKSTYSKAIKQNEDYAKSLDKVNGKLLSFDTFNTLSAGNGEGGAKGLFEEVEVASEMNDFAQALTQVFGIIKELFGILKEGFNLIKEIFEYIRPQLDIIFQFVGGFIQHIRGVVQLIRGILKIFTGDFQGAFDLIGKGFENLFKGIGNMFRGVLNSIIDGINFLFVQLNPLKWIVDLFGGDTSGWGIPHIPQFANGGSFNTADMFYANENGQTELIASTNNGGAVMNTEQLQEAIYTGMSMAMSERGGQEVVLKVDQNTLGRVVANSSGFISETNRIKLIKV